MDEMAAAGAIRDQPIDPFGYHVGMASRIEGLGGSTKFDADPNYAFHTPYIEVGEGAAGFKLRFRNLRAKFGTLTVRVHMHDRKGDRLILATSARLQFNRLIAMGGEATIKFEGFRGMSFALYGGVEGQGDAQAEGLEVELERYEAEGDAHAPALEAVNSAYRRDGLRPVPLLLSLGEPRLQFPVSQMATVDQTKEDAFREWVRLLDLKRLQVRDQWNTAFVLQAAKLYAKLDRGARILSFKPADHPVNKYFDSQGADVVCSTVPAVAEDLSRDLVNFDLLLSIDCTENMFVADGAVYLIDVAMRCLRPGGLAVHVLPYQVDSTDQGGVGTGATLVGRRQVERISLVLISRHHEVAQLKPKGRKPILGRIGNDGLETGSFGIIARKAQLSE